MRSGSLQSQLPTLLGTCGALKIEGEVGREEVGEGGEREYEIG